MTVHGVDDVVGIKRFSIVELDAFPQLERPLGHLGIRAPLFGELGGKGKVVIKTHQAVVISTPTYVVEN